MTDGVTDTYSGGMLVVLHTDDWWNDKQIPVKTCLQFSIHVTGGMMDNLQWRIACSSRHKRTDGMTQRTKTHKRLKLRFIIGRNRAKCAHFWGSPLFQAMHNTKTEKQTHNFSLVPFSFHQPPKSNWHKISWIVCFSVFMLYMAWKRGLPWKFAWIVLFCKN